MVSTGASGDQITDGSMKSKGRVNEVSEGNEIAPEACLVTAYAVIWLHFSHSPRLCGQLSGVY